MRSGRSPVTVHLAIGSALGSSQMVRRAATVLMTACLVVSCSTSALDEQADPAPTVSVPPKASAQEPAPSRSVPPQQPPAQDLLRLPSTPALRGPAVLAGQLDRATATLRDRDSSATDVRRAAEFQQLAVRTLATASKAFHRKVMARVDTDTARVIGGMVRAAKSLHSITDPQQQLPRWRIIAPPPVAELRGYYKGAQRRTDVPWTYLAAIHLVETRMGRIRGTSTAGARGPMQFLPSTWEIYGAGGDINDPRDAIRAAARLLKDHGAPGDMAGALWHYNPADHYVRAVTAHARTMQRWSYTYRGYWHWRVLYRHVRGTYVLPIGYPHKKAVLLPGT